MCTRATSNALPYRDRPRSAWLRPVVPIVLLSVGFLAGFATHSRAEASATQDSPHAIVEQLARVLVLVENHYVEPVDRNKMLEGAIKGMVGELDAHSEYLPPREFQELTEETVGRFGGVGLEVEVRGPWLVVVHAIEGGPAEAAGLLPDDEIVRIDATDARGLRIDRSILLMRGAPGTSVQLVLRRPSDGDKLYRVVLQRAEIKVPSVLWELLPPGVLYLRLKQFQESTHTDLLTAVRIARKRLGGAPRGVLLDLRHNPGGLVHQAVEVADEFLAGGTIFSMRGNRGRTAEQANAGLGGALLDIPAAVLVDEGSASASELVAAALQDHGRALIVGQPTFGKGSVQTLIDLPNGAGLKLTTARYYSPKGRPIQAQGVTPDVLVEGPKPTPRKVPPLKERDLPQALPAEQENVAALPYLPPRPATAAASVGSSKKADPASDPQLRTALEAVVAKRNGK